MLPKRASYRPTLSEQNNQEIEQSISNAEDLAEKELRHMTKKSNYLAKKKREKRRK